MVAWLSVSSDALSENCSEVISAMRTLKLVGDVTPNKTLNPDGSVEAGCRVLIAGRDGSKGAQALWGLLRAHVSGLQCAHVLVEHREAGCVFDVFATSPSCVD